MRGYGLPPAPSVSGQGDLGVIGPIARYASDLALSLEVLAGPDEAREGAGYRLALPPPRHADLKNFRILVIDTHPLMPTANSVRTAISELAMRLSTLGAKVAYDSGSLPNLAHSAPLYMELLNAARSPRLSSDAFVEAKREAAALSPDDHSLQAELSRGSVMSHREWLAADAVRLQLQQQWSALFREFDVVLYPSASVPAFPQDHSEPIEARHLDIDGQAYPYLAACFIWADPATTCGLPATAAPIGKSATDLPIGMQIIGPYLGDHTTIVFAELLEREFGGFVPPFL
jgi:amidase